jgi:hypothetical protein
MIEGDGTIASGLKQSGWEIFTGQNMGLVGGGTCHLYKITIHVSGKKTSSEPAKRISLVELAGFADIYSVDSDDRDCGMNSVVVVMSTATSSQNPFASVFQQNNLFLLGDGITVMVPADDEGGFSTWRLTI